MTNADITSAGMTGTAPAGASISYGTDPGDPSRADIVGGVGERLSNDEVTAFVTRALARADLDDKRVCLVVPDGTRTCPLPLLMRAAQSALEGRAKEVTVVDRARHPPGNERRPSGASHGLFDRRRLRRPIPAGTSSTTNPGCRRRSPHWAASARSG